VAPWPPAALLPLVLLPCEVLPLREEGTRDSANAGCATTDAAQHRQWRMAPLQVRIEARRDAGAIAPQRLSRHSWPRSSPASSSSSS
jgi:hypothetical protein